MPDENRDPAISDADISVVRSAQTGEGLVEIKTVEQLDALVHAAGHTKDAFDLLVAGMTREAPHQR